MEQNEKIFLLGRATAVIERITNMPHRVVAKIAQCPIEMVNFWLKDATIKDPDALIDIMSQIDEIPTSLSIYQQGSFWIGYFKQRHASQSNK